MNCEMSPPSPRRRSDARSSEAGASPSSPLLWRLESDGGGLKASLHWSIEARNDFSFQQLDVFGGIDRNWIVVAERSGGQLLARPARPRFHGEVPGSTDKLLHRGTMLGRLDPAPKLETNVTEKRRQANLTVCAASFYTPGVDGASRNLNRALPRSGTGDAG